MRSLNLKIFAILIIFTNYSCVGGKKDPVTGKVEIIEPNSEKRARGLFYGTRTSRTRTQSLL